MGPGFESLEVHRQMQDGILHAVQCRSHFLYRPNDALLRGLLGAVHRNRTFDKNAPLYGILEGCTQQPMHLMDGSAGKEPLTSAFRSVPCFFPSIYEPQGVLLRVV